MKNKFMLAGLLMGLKLFAVNAQAEVADAAEPERIDPASCWQQLVELQNMLHAANQQIELLRSENRELHLLIPGSEEQGD